MADLDGISDKAMIDLRFVNLRSDRSGFDHPADVFIGITADVELVTEVGTIYREVDFPVVELAGALVRWLREGSIAGEDFEFDSMETPEPGWIWIRRTGHGWRVGSIHQELPDVRVRELVEIRLVIERFLSQLEEGMWRIWGLRLDSYL